MRRGRTFLVVALICALLLTGAVQSVATQQRKHLLKGDASQGGSSLATMDSYALALLLGGLRGPLVMFLWMQSEASKAARDLEGVETQIEWIRLLQPEFDTVHLFQIWNKAYNISAQIAGWAGKYRIIADAIDYITAVDRQRPDNIHMLTAMGGVYNDKLGGSFEKAYYDRRVREDTKFREEPASRFGPSRRTRVASMLNPDGTIREALLQPRFPVSSTQPAGAEPYDGSELQFLKRYQPFAYGLSPRALGYNYLKRAQTLQVMTGQMHMQISPMVIDSRPALTMRQWADAEWDRAIAAEGRLLNVQTPVDRFEAFVATGKGNPLALSAEDLKARDAARREALDASTLSIRVMQDALVEFNRHLANPEYQIHVAMYASHLDHLNAAIALAQADLTLLKAQDVEQAQKQKLVAEAQGLYRKAIRGFLIVRLKYYSDRTVYGPFMPPGSTLKAVDDLSDEQLQRFTAMVRKAVEGIEYHQFTDDLKEYDSYLTRAETRLGMLGR